MIAVVDPLGLHAFAQQILTAIQGMAPVAAVGLVLILVAYGLLRARG